jgi:hypothetical protein
MKHAMIKKRTNKIMPQPIPEQEQPRPNPNLFSSHSKSQSSKMNFSIPEKQPGFDDIAFSYEKIISTLKPDS